MDLLEEILHGLLNGNDRQRRAAAYKLIKFKDPSTVPYLIEAYNKNTDQSLRMNVVEALKAIDTDEARVFLISLVPVKVREQIETREREQREAEARIFAQPSLIQKREYLIILAYRDQVIRAGDREYAKLDSSSLSTEIKIEKDSAPLPQLGDFLNDIGEAGWEVIGTMVDENSGDYWRRLPVKIIAKRRLSEE